MEATPTGLRPAALATQQASLTLGCGFAPEKYFFRSTSTKKYLILGSQGQKRSSP